MICIVRDIALSAEEIDEKIKMFRVACDTGDDADAKEALKHAAPTFVDPEEVNHAFDRKTRFEENNREVKVAAVI